MVYNEYIYYEYGMRVKREKEKRSRENLQYPTPMEEVGPVWLVRRCETLAANAAILDNMWSKPVADHSEVEFHIIISSRGEKASGASWMGPARDF